MRILVTGAGDFLGQGIVNALCQRGEEVHTLQRGDYDSLNKAGVIVNKGDIADKQAVINASKDCEAIMHVAARAGVWGDYQDYSQ